jgi:hypothetical protein
LVPITYKIPAIIIKNRVKKSLKKTEVDSSWNTSNDYGV